MTETIQCCGQPAKKSFSRQTNTFTILCDKCGKVTHGKTREAAEKAFREFKQVVSDVPAISIPAVGMPSTPTALAPYMASQILELSHIAIPFIGRDRPALTRLIKNTVRYVMRQKGPAWERCWKTLEGQESIIHGIEESLTLGAEMPKLGCLVPFGDVVEFIPAVEAYEFALTAGTNPPFKWIMIDIIHKNDIHELSRIDGVFSCNVKPGMPRGPVIGVAVYGLNTRLEKVVGEAYDSERLLGKAAQHSSSYRAFLRQLQAFEYARTEGKVEIDAEGREYAEVVFSTDAKNDKYFEQDVETFEAAEAAGRLKTNTRGEYAEVEIPKKDGKVWKKKIYRSSIENPGTETRKLYRDEIANPYDGPDQAEMLRKAAGKSFLGKYARVRNSEAAMDEVRGSDEEEAAAVVDATLDAAFSNMDTPGPEEVKTPPRPEPEPEPDISDELEEIDSSNDGALVKEFKQKAAAQKEQGELGI